MLSTLEAVQNIGLNAQKLDVWSRDGDFDILHVWGLDHIHEMSVYFAKKAGKKVVITSLFRDFSTLNIRIRHLISKYAGAAKIMKRIAAMADSIVVVNDIEADFASKYFNIDADKIYYIPNIVDYRYYEINNKPGLFHSFDNFVLCTGNICKRKNQLNLIKACISKSIKLVLMGNPLLGEEEYCREVRRLVGDNPDIMWIEGVKENSSELFEAYEKCAIFALPSVFEQGPISAYEALASNCKVLIADRRYAYQEFYKHVKRVNPFSVEDIAQGISVIMERPEDFVSPSDIVDACKAKNVALAYQNVYQKMLKK